MTKVIHNRKHLKDRRRTLRNNLTPAEAKLWTYLKNSQLENRKFRRQHSIENFIVDFYCPSESLVIELDGQHHFDSFGAASEIDIKRDDRLSKLGIHVIRFENKDVFEQPDFVLTSIKELFNSNKK